MWRQSLLCIQWQFRFCRLSKDHSYVQDLVDQGKLDPENAFDHPYSNIITRCLGDPTNRSNPDFRSYNLRMAILSYCVVMGYVVYATTKR